MDGNEPVNPAWQNSDRELLRTVYWEERCRLAERLLNHVFTKKEIGRAYHINALEKKVGKLQEEVTHQRKAAEYRNRQLRAANLIISCTGGCDTGVIGSKESINEELVGEVERTAKRLRTPPHNYQSKRGRKQEQTL